MTPDREYKPRLSVEIPARMDHDLKQLIPHNLKSPLIRAMLETLISLLKEKPDARINIINLIVVKDFDLARATYHRAVEPSPESGNEAGQA